MEVSIWLAETSSAALPCNIFGAVGLVIELASGVFSAISGARADSVTNGLSGSRALVKKRLLQTRPTLSETKP